MIQDQLQQLLTPLKASINSIEILPASGGDRKYFRIFTNQQTYIATLSKNIIENKTFLEFTKIFNQLKIPVPTVYNIDANNEIYIQNDLGKSTLLDAVLQIGFTDDVYKLYGKSLSNLAKMQIEAANKIDYNLCLVSKKFDNNATLADLNYFKYYFLDLQNVEYNKQILQNEFEQLSKSIGETPSNYFMFRDFQGRNIMVQNDEVIFIDYQGGMQGPLQYDVASLLWQAKAALPNDWKKNLLQYYFTKANELLHSTLDWKIFEKNYYQIVLMRLLQVLGAYGLRGIIEQKQHFLSSIPQALQNIKEWLAIQNIEQTYPELNKILHQLISTDFTKKFMTIKANEQTPLVVKIKSFSYKIGIPQDETNNGGGFIFDCRGILNPGRIEAYKKQTGRDADVKQYLETQTLMPQFLKNVFGIVSISVEDYLQRNFDSLMISFGCTGGQHRSVYAANATAKYLQEKYNVKVELEHCVQEKKNWIN